MINPIKERDICLLVINIKRIIFHSIRFITKRDYFEPLSFKEAKSILFAIPEGPYLNYRWRLDTDENFLAIRKFIQSHFLVLDFGIGIGRIAKEILIEFSQVKIIGVDSSKGMLKYCKRFIPAEHQNRLELLHFTELNRIKPSSIDFMFSIYTLQHAPGNLFEPALKELRRVIKPDGLFYLLNRRDRLVFDRKSMKWYDDGIRQLDIISKYFEEIEDIGYQSEPLTTILREHNYFSKLFRSK